ncbi:MAG TPA: amidohydrolase family protein [Stellaceae bacterium]|jgi:aminocarboxymuconate-semialdehyde decarboxylase|nr:amidohydrolase family protein [Stellaceae bacterium]
MNIDVHAHIIGPAFYDAIKTIPGVTTVPNRYGMGILKHGETVINISQDWFDSKHHVGEMDKRGIDISLLSLTTPNLYVFPKDMQAQAARIANDEAVDRARLYPSRIRVLASLPLDDIPAAVQEVDRVAAIKEVCGISVGSNVNGVALSDARFEPVWAQINQHKMAVVEHPNFPPFSKDLPEYNLSLMLGFFFETQICVTRMIVNGIFARNPDMKFIVAHTGAGMLGIMNRLRNIPRAYPDAQEKMKHRPFEEFAKNLYYDSCAIDQNALMLAYNYVGREHMMFGTDYPYTNHGPEHVTSLPISAEDKALMLSGNAERVFGLN